MNIKQQRLPLPRLVRKSAEQKAPALLWPTFRGFLCLCFREARYEANSLLAQ